MKQAAAVIGLGFVGRAHVYALRRLAIPIRVALGSPPNALFWRSYLDTCRVDSRATSSAGTFRRTIGTSRF
jgi:hypothetical protein